MFEFRKCKRFGACNNCGVWHDEEHPVYDFKISIDGTGWNVVMLCLDCLKEVVLTAENLLNDIDAEESLDNNNAHYGEWLPTGLPDVFQCSRCKKGTKMDELCDSEILRAYCPNCGKKMVKRCS